MLGRGLIDDAPNRSASREEDLVKFLVQQSGGFRDTTFDDFEWL